MKLMLLFLIIPLLHVGATTNGQTVTLKKTNVALTVIFKEIKKQTGYDFLYASDLFADAKKVTISVSNIPLSAALELCFKDQPLTYSIENKFIRVARKRPAYFEGTIKTIGLITITGSVTDTLGKPLAGANVKVLGETTTVRTNEQGNFIVTSRQNTGTIIISYLGYKTQEINFSETNLGPFKVILKELQSGLQEVEVVSTGYYQVAIKKSPGSFTQINNEDINRSVTPNIIDRLEGITNGLQFDRRNITGENALARKPELRIRGLSTIQAGSAPLIIVDNFPYEGDITSINANDVESVTILKDAAASSIWGARAGNGVIVINTKRGRYNQQSNISFNSSVNLTNKPDLFYTRNFLPSETVMDIQQDMFQRKAYTESNFNYIPGYVELLIKKRDNLITAEEFESQKLQLQQTDFRDQALDNLYQTGVQQQYALNASGGSNTYNYYLSAGYDDTKENVIGNASNRFNLNAQNTFKVSNNLELNAGFWYSLQSAMQNGINYSSIGLGVREPYTLLADQDGNALATGYSGKRFLYQQRAVNNGLLDWLYRPLDEVRLNDITSGSSEARLNAGLKYNILNSLNLVTSYQYLRGTSENQTYYGKGSFYARDLINSFTQPNGTRIIPNGGILDGGSPGTYIGHSGRVQINYNKNFLNSHSVSALAGAEINQQIAQKTPGFRYYDSSKEYLGGRSNFDYTTVYPTLPAGYAYIPSSYSGISASNNRNLSYFFNGTYSYLDRYVLSSSLRWDGSNLLGVKTNQRGTALWSLGGSWELSKERFYSLIWLPYLRIRTTYGKSGLIDKSQSQYPTIGFLNDSQTNLESAILMHPGNPNLRWEQVGTLNLAIDFVIINQRITGSFDYYHKSAKDLLGNILIDPTVGAGSNYKENYADMTVTGFDLQLNTQNLDGVIKWRSNLLLNYSENKVTRYNTPAGQYTYTFLNSSTKQPVVGRSVDVVYAIPWNGLDHNTGLPIVFIDGKQSSNYATYINGLKPENLQVAGLDVAPYYGSLRNTLTLKQFEISALLSFKWGYVFRRTSMLSGAEFQLASPLYNLDYYKRWKNPGDEVNTDVPAATQTYDVYMGQSYSQSSTLISSGNHIRLQDITLSYDLKIAKGLPFRQVRFYMYGRNLGIIWKKNKYGIDPDYQYSEFPAPRSFAFGIRAGI